MLQVVATNMLVADHVKDSMSLGRCYAELTASQISTSLSRASNTLRSRHAPCLEAPVDDLLCNVSWVKSHTISGAISKNTRREDCVASGRAYDKLLIVLTSKEAYV